MTADQRVQFGHSKDRALHPTGRADRIEHAVCGEQAGGRLGAAFRD